MSMLRALVAEFRKLRNSRALLATALVWLFMGSVAAFFLWIIGNPGQAENLGLVGRKVSLAAGDLSADWTSLFALAGQMAGLGGMIIYSFIVSWLFGREYAAGTAKCMLASPLRRSWAVLAKLVVSALWYLGLSALLVLETIAIGNRLGLDGYSARIAAEGAGRILVLAPLVVALGPAVALAAIVGKGYLAPLSYSILAMLVGTVLGVTDWARWVPWAIVPMFSGAAGPRADEIGAGSFVVLALFFAATLAGAMAVIERADVAN